MNKLVNISVIISIALLLSVPVNASENPLKGTWHLVSGEYINEEGIVINYQALGLSSQIVIDEKNFAFVTMKKQQFWAAGAGHYTLDKNYYYETPTKASYPLEDGGTYKFSYKVIGNKWVKERWRDAIRVEYEVWQKVN